MILTLNKACISWKQHGKHPAYGTGTLGDSGRRFKLGPGGAELVQLGGTSTSRQPAGLSSACKVVDETDETLWRCAEETIATITRWNLE